MIKIKYKAIKSKYWRPGTDYFKSIVKLVRDTVNDRDVIVISEKSIATAKGNIINEQKVTPNIVAFFLAKIWIKIVWGYFLGYLCRFKKQTLIRLRKYPVIEGARHKQIVLDQAGLFQALGYGSEGGIDLSNLPYSYACLPLGNPLQEAANLSRYLHKNTGKKITIIISDTDSTFSLNNLHFTAHPHSIEGIISVNNPLAFIIGRFFRLTQRATPIAISGLRVSLEDAIRFSEIAHHARGYGAGRTIWDGAKKFHVRPADISWEMLDTVDHYPIVIIRYNKL